MHDPNKEVKKICNAALDIVQVGFKPCVIKVLDCVLNREEWVCVSPILEKEEYVCLRSSLFSSMCLFTCTSIQHWNGIFGSNATLL